MDIETSTNEDFRYLFTFHDDEVRAVGAAFREHIFYLASKGNTSSISDYEHYVARHWASEDQRGLFVNDPERTVVNILEEFHGRTDEAIMDMPEASGVPPFLDENIPERKYLGDIALALAQEIREKTTVAEFQEKLDAVMPEDFGTTD